MFISDAAPKKTSVEDEISTLQAHINAATAELLSYVARLETEDIWAQWSGVRSAPDWVAWRLGLTRAESCRYVETAVKLESLPEIKAAFAKGEFSFEQVATICTVATPDTQQTMLTLLRYSTAIQLKRICAAYLREVSSMDAAVKHASHYVRRRKTPDGMYQLSARLSPEDGAVLDQALAAAMEKLREEEDAEASAADALVALAHGSLGTGAMTGSSAERFQVNIHIDLENLLGEDGKRSEIEGWGSIHPATAQRLCCDGGIVTFFEKGGEIVGTGRKTRTISPALRRALYSRDKHCRFPGCNQSVFTEAHHILFWGKGGEHKLGNLVRLCSFHHKLVHEAGLTIEVLPDADFRFKTPDGTTISRFLRRLKAEGEDLRHKAFVQGLEIGPETSVTDWDGSRLNLTTVVNDLFFTGPEKESLLVAAQARLSGDPPETGPPRSGPPTT